MKTPKISAAISALILFAHLSADAAEQTNKVESAELPLRWDELTAPDFVRAVKKADATAIVPFGILEKHGLHLPLGADLIFTRELALRAARQEYVIIFPDYYFGQIFEAKHQPGAVAYSPRVMWDLLQETCDEMARNGIKKIIIFNGHGGNISFLRYFVQFQLASRKDYAVYYVPPHLPPTAADPDPAYDARFKAMKKTTVDGHAGELETSLNLFLRPDLVKLEHAGNESGADLKRLAHLDDVQTGMWWYSSFPNHYAGDGTAATRELGELVVNQYVKRLVKIIRTIKSDKTTLELQKRFFEESTKPLATPQGSR